MNHSSVFFIAMLTFTGLTAEEEYLPDTLTWYCLSECKFKPQCSSEEQTSAVFRVGSSLSDPHSFSTPSLSISVSVSFLLPGPARTPLSFILILFHASSFPRSILIHHHPHPAPHTPAPPSSIQPGSIQIQPSLGLSADTLLCDSSLHWTPFGIHHFAASLSPSDWDTSEKQWI